VASFTQRLRSQGYVLSEETGNPAAKMFLA
jgi:hypothetical protein